jgi:hypothetical protein
MDTIISISDGQYVLQANNRYTHSKAPVLEIFESDTGMPCGVITVCIPGVQLTKQETILKPIDGDDIVALLVGAGIAVSNGRIVRSGYANYPVVELSSDFIKRSKIAVH